MIKFCELDIKEALERANKHTKLISIDGGCRVVLSKSGGGKTIKMMELAVESAMMGQTPLIVSNEMDQGRISSVLSLLMDDVGLIRGSAERKALDIRIIGSTEYYDTDIEAIVRVVNTSDVDSAFLDCLLGIYSPMDAGMRIHGILDEFTKPVTITMATNRDGSSMFDDASKGV